jgi:hypothetical protein
VALMDIDYIAPQEIFLGQRCHTVIKNHNNSTKIVKETFQYISIARTLASLLKCSNLNKLVTSEKPNTKKYLLILKIKTKVLKYIKGVKGVKMADE